MKVLIVGGGGREHALAWRLRHEDPSIELIAAPGNAGISELARCVPVGPTDVDRLLALADAEAVGLTVVGPEVPLEHGIVDVFRARRLLIFGPTRAAAMIETSKAFSKQLMREAGVPTARAEICASVSTATEAIERFGAPVVIKASGLAAGKGVSVCMTAQDAREAIGSMLERSVFGEAGHTVLVEEYMEGEELSVFFIANGTSAVALVPAQDHKRLLAGDLGPNTGGMGAYAPVSITERHPELLGRIADEIVEPTLRGLRERGTPFTGLLYAGLMLTSDGPKVVEFNCRFGDPETQVVLPVMSDDSSLLDLLMRSARGEALPIDFVTEADGHAVTTVIASRGYPDNPRTGDPIHLPPAPDDVLVFHAATRRDEDGRLVSSGGRVLAVTALAGSFDEAQRTSLDYASRVGLAEKQFRDDIGWRELGRLGRARETAATKGAGAA
jgi:phosphoribosylamine--glycine ligase